jgi:pimeloyl-ACP methyl ester carboxylesterase
MKMPMTSVRPKVCDARICAWNSGEDRDRFAFISGLNVAWRLAFLVIAFALVGCSGPLAHVRHKPARYPHVAAQTGESQSAQRHILEGSRLAKREPRAAIGEYLKAAEASLSKLRRQPSDAAALRDYDYALSRVFSVIRDAKLSPWDGPFEVPGYTVTHHKDSRKRWNPAEYDLLPTDELVVSGTAFHQPVRRAGLGAPLVAAHREADENFREEFLPSAHVYYGVTAVANFEGTRCSISFEDPLAKEKINVLGRAFPLAGDFNTALAMLVARDRPEKMGITRLLHPAEHDDTLLLYRLQPFDPKRIPVVFVHGLQDTPASWMPMFNELLADPVIRRRYQFWFFSYPSGYPFPYSAALLRTQLDAMARHFPQRRDVVMIGHSMGGLLTRLMLTDSGDDAMWRYLFNRPPEHTPFTAEDRALMSSVLLFKPRKEIDRAIFISTPHRGSDMASNWIGKISTHLVHLPKKLVRAGADMAAVATQTHGGFHLRRMPNSIDTLSPTSSFVIAMNQRPLAPGVPFHQIQGDRGRGDSPHSSDGVVAYWSSHLEGAQSGRIVPSGHGAHKNEEGIEEVKRILKDHLATSAR